MRGFRGLSLLASTNGFKGTYQSCCFFMDVIFRVINLQSSWYNIINPSYELYLSKEWNEERIWFFIVFRIQSELDLTKTTDNHLMTHQTGLLVTGFALCSVSWSFLSFPRLQDSKHKTHVVTTIHHQDKHIWNINKINNQNGRTTS